MYPNHHKMSMLSHRGMGLALKMHRLKGCGYFSNYLTPQPEAVMYGSGAVKKLEGGKLKRKPLLFRF